jgi:hypothetical protein
MGGLKTEYAPAFLLRITDKHSDLLGNCRILDKNLVKADILPIFRLQNKSIVIRHRLE